MLLAGFWDGVCGCFSRLFDFDVLVLMVVGFVDLVFGGGFALLWFGFPDVWSA